MNDLKQKRKDRIKQMNVFQKLAIFLGMYRIWYEPREKLPPLRCEKVVAWHPLNWVFVLIIWLGVVLKTAFWDFWAEGVAGSFKTTKWG